jgi:lycopene beta-cyclase
MSTPMNIPMKNVQVVIIGGGCAGLSLGSRLAQTPKAPSTIIIEPRVEYAEDRTWCFWSNEGSHHNHLPLTRWSKVHVSYRESMVTVNLKRDRYQMLRSMDFYQDKCESIAKSTDVELQMGEKVTTVTRSMDGYWITETNVGVYRSEFVIDTRPMGAGADSPPCLWQTFLGLEIECDQSTFDCDTAHLMDFADVVDGNIPFIYLLPVSDRQALVELTSISRNRLDPETMVGDLRIAITKMVGAANYRIVRTESGAIPMGLAQIARDRASTYVNIGVTEGSARPSSGYAFCRIQRWADACCESLLNGKPPLNPLIDSAIVRFMDKVFLQVVRNQPHMGPEIFVRMFKNVPMSRLIRFLIDKPTVVDAISIIASLPKIVFLKECFNWRRHRQRSMPKILWSR